MAERFRVLLGAACCVAVMDAQALSIGTARGEPTVGQALDLTFDVALDAGSDANSACVSADLFYGDTRIDGSRVRVSARAGTQPLQALVQVASPTAVNEPVVTVVLRAGCGTAVSRRFVLLSSSPVEATLPSGIGARPLPAPIDIPQRSAAGAVGSVPANNPAGTPSRRNAVAAPASAGVARAATHARPSAQAQASHKKTAAPGQPVAAAAERAPAVGSNRPRLELQSPVDWAAPEQVLPLKASDSMATPTPTTTPEQRALAAALWRTLNSSSGGDATPAPPDAEAQQKVQALEAQVKTLQNGARMARGREGDLQGRLDEAQRDRDTAWFIVWPLAALVVLAALVGGFIFWRKRSGVPMVWWKGRQQADFGDDAATAFAEGFVDTQPAPVDFNHPAGEVHGHGASDDQGHASAPDFEATRPPHEEEHAVAPTSAEAAMRAARELRSGSANALADVQQNADFFASLGQYEQAIELLQEYIASHPGTSPVAYLDLLKLFHTLSLTDPYAKLRSDFNVVFNAEVPPFASFLKPTRDLVAYADVLLRISESWNRSHVLDLIESLLVRHSGDGAHPPFQLEAYRDLLLLYEIAKVQHGTEGAKLVAPPSGMSTAAAAPVVPAPAAAASVAPAATLPFVTTPPAPAPAPITPPSYLSGTDIDFAIDAPAALGSLPQSPPPNHLGVALDFSMPESLGGSGLGSLDDLGIPPIPQVNEPPSRPSAAAPATDPHLIDFDMFDIALPPADKPKS